MTAEDTESRGKRGFRRALQWCLFAWGCMLLGLCGGVVSGTVAAIGSGILAVAGLLFALISAFLALLGMLFPGGVARIRFFGLLVLSVLPFIALLCIFIVNITDTLRSMTISATRAEIAALSTALDFYQSDCGSYPTTEQGLKPLFKKPGITGWRGPYLRKVPLDGWGRELRYISTKGHFQLLSAGPDGAFQTGDDITSF